MRSLRHFYIIVLAISFLTTSSFPWGDEGHSLIGRMSTKYFPKEMKAFAAYKDYLNEHSKDPDYRKKADKTEGMKHFIDIDFYKEFQNGVMIHSEDSLLKIYSEKDINKNGILPWATLETYNKLIQAFKNKDKEKILLYISDLSHYVGDGHQPMHSLTNYDGQLTGQKGLHSRYEITMVDAHISELESAFRYKEVEYIKNPLDFIFSYITNTNILSSIVFDADTYAYNICHQRSGNEYYRLMWFRTSYITKLEITDAAYDLACLVYSAWTDAGKPTFKKIK